MEISENIQAWRKNPKHCTPSSQPSTPLYLLPGNDHVVLDISKHRRLDEVASVCCHSSSTHQFGTFSLPTADVAQNLFELLLIYLETSQKEQHVKVYTKVSELQKTLNVPEKVTRTLVNILGKTRSDPDRRHPSHFGCSSSFLGIWLNNDNSGSRPRKSLSLTHLSTASEHVNSYSSGLTLNP